MGMTKDQFKVLVKAMKAVYTNPGFIPDQNAFDVWYGMLKDLDYAIASRAVQIYLQTEVIPPTIAGIRNQLTKLTKSDGDNLNEMTAWELVKKARRRSGYYENEEFEKLPPIVQRAIGSPAKLHELSVSEDLNESVESSNFMRAFRVEQQREQERAKISPDVLKFIENLESRQLTHEKEQESKKIEEATERGESGTQKATENR